MREKSMLALTLLLCQSVTELHAYVVHDPIHTVLNILQQTIGQIKEAAYHTQDIGKYAEMIQKQMQQIRQFTTMINQNVDELRRMGDPQTYVNMLDLDSLLDEVEKFKSGVGQTISEYQQTVNGIASLKDTANGLYGDLSRLSDRFGQTVRFDEKQFKQYGAVQQMYQSYNTQLEQANRSLSRLSQEKQSTLQQLNSAGSLIEVEKIKAKLQSLEGSIQNAAGQVMAAGQKLLVQAAANQNNEARLLEANREMRVQEAEEENAALRQAGAQLLAPPENP